MWQRAVFTPRKYPEAVVKRESQGLGKKELYRISLEYQRHIWELIKSLWLHPLCTHVHTHPHFLLNKVLRKVCAMKIENRETRWIRCMSCKGQLLQWRLNVRSILERSQEESDMRIRLLKYKMVCLMWFKIGRYFCWATYPCWFSFLC